jgi:ferredoxin
MNVAELTREVKEYAREQGADLVGIGSMDRFEGAPRDSDPRHIMPEAKSIIGLGFRIHRGALRGIEEGTHFGSYPSLCYANINDVHAPVVLRQVGSLIEDAGYETFLYGNSIVRYAANAGRPVRDGLPKPDVFLHFRIAAFICGMGEIGWSKVFLTPQFGPRQRFAFILTDAELEPDPLYDGEPLCDRCMRCVADCPVDAIPADESVKVTVAGRELEWGLLDLKRCGLGWQAANPELNPFAKEEVTAYMRRVMADDRDRVQRDREIWEPVSDLKKMFGYTRNGWHYFRHPGAICGGRGCIRGCMIHLEDRGCLKNTFKDRFRRRTPWKLEPVDAGGAGEREK